MRPIADILHLIHTRASLSKADADGYELWELAAACGLHLLPEGEDETTEQVVADSAAAAEAHAEKRRERIARANAQRAEKRQQKRARR